MNNFYCQQKCGVVDFSIDEWNQAQKEMEALTTEQRNFIEAPKNCKQQCKDCTLVVEARRKTTMKLIKQQKSHAKK